MGLAAEEEVALVVEGWVASSAEIVRIVAREGSYIKIFQAELVKAFPKDLIFQILDPLGDLIGRRANDTFLIFGPHIDMVATGRPIKQAGRAWAVALLGPGMNRLKFDAQLVAEIESLAADFFVESHHVFPVEFLKIFQSDLAALGSDLESIIAQATGVLTPAHLHRGVAYLPLEVKTARIADVRKALPSPKFNLTDALRKKFPKSTVAAGRAAGTTTLDSFLTELSDFYRETLPTLYIDQKLPNKAPSGFRGALVDFANRAGRPNPEQLILPPKPKNPR